MCSSVWIGGRGEIGEIGDMGDGGVTSVCSGGGLEWLSKCLNVSVIDRLSVGRNQGGYGVSSNMSSNSLFIL